MIIAQLKCCNQSCIVIKLLLFFPPSLKEGKNLCISLLQVEAQAQIPGREARKGDKMFS